MSQLKEKYPIPFLVVEVGYSVGIEGNNVLCIQAKDAAIIGRSDDGQRRDEPRRGTQRDPHECGQRVHESDDGQRRDSLSSMFNKKVDITPPL